MYQPPALENDGAELNFMNDGDKYLPRNDQDLREILRIFVSNKNLALAPTAKFTVFIETPSKPFNSWTFPKVCELYELSDDPNPSIDVYSVFQCGCANTKEEKYKEALRKFFDELETRVTTTPLTCPMRPQKASIPIPFSPQQLTHLKAK
ncbi:3904_t:CDS:1 [Funneliformis caledonium]|uniref:3904_t:CDS:1 n=1 Tax=Funneliformis caledonium TaxID=1117310 RepID=A0A9N9I740_9GLOM|nr:3904_t:CDS:1 [Funneliformis caledonium]